MTDLDQARLDRGIGYVHHEIDGLVAKRRVDGDRAERIKALVTGSPTKDTFSDAAFVIEAVFEEMSVKQKIFAEVEAQVSPECVLATNTSSFSVTEMAAQLRHPERVVGLHFFTQLYSGSIATVTPQTFAMASPPPELRGFGVNARTQPRPRVTRCSPAPIHQI